MTRSCLLLLFLTASGACSAQTRPTDDSVKSAVNRLFDAMRKSDSAMIGSCFTPGALLQTLDERKEPVTVVTDSITQFARIISALPIGAADERPRIDVVRVDGNLAIVWAPYQFFYKGTFHHCGVDSFQLVRSGGVWKIQYIIDTEHRDGCP
jgi:hypothetical protein